MSVVIWKFHLTWLLLISWAITVSGARQLQVQIIHYAAHDALSQRGWVNELIGVLLSGLLLITDFRSYKEGHIRHHSAKILGTAEDDTFRFLFTIMHLKPGLPIRILWLRFLLAPLSPLFHFRFFAWRIAPIIKVADVRHTLVALVWVGLLVTISWITDFHLGLLVSWGVPLFFLYHISAGIRLCVEHRYRPKGFELVKERAFYATLTWAVFPGELAPRQYSTWFKGAFTWAVWISKILLIHLPSRLLVLVGDTPCHDYHHRHPKTPNWPNFILGRQADSHAGCPGWNIPYRAVWGLVPAIHRSLECISKGSDTTVI